VDARGLAARGAGPRYFFALGPSAASPGPLGAPWIPSIISLRAGHPAHRLVVLASHPGVSLLSCPRIAPRLGGAVSRLLVLHGEPLDTTASAANHGPTRMRSWSQCRTVSLAPCSCSSERPATPPAQSAFAPPTATNVTTAQERPRRRLSLLAPDPGENGDRAPHSNLS
jgi:hypothetical protein